MISLRWAAACMVTLALIGGCQNTKKEPETATVAGPADPEKTAAAKAKYAAMGDRLVGEVDAVNEKYAAVSGIDPKALTIGDVVTFIDVDNNTMINNGTFVEVGLSGRIVVEYGKTGQRPPRKGDLCVRLK
jgi:hypothetical protein